MQLSETDAREFESWWKAYPRKVAKGDARKAWMQTRTIRPQLPQLLAAVDAARRCDQWRRDGGQYVPYPATWLRGERWADEHEVQVLTESQARPWHETRSGIEARAGELGIDAQRYPHFPALKAAVLEADRLTNRVGGNVTALARRRA